MTGLSLSRYGQELRRLSGLVLGKMIATNSTLHYHDETIAAFGPTQDSATTQWQSKYHMHHASEGCHTRSRIFAIRLVIKALTCTSGALGL